MLSLCSQIHQTQENLLETSVFPIFVTTDVIVRRHHWRINPHAAEERVPSNHRRSLHESYEDCNNDGTSAAYVENYLLNDLVLNYGPTKERTGNDGSRFTSKSLQNVFNIMKISKNFSTMYHPKSNGKVERYKRTILAKLRTYFFHGRLDVRIKFPATHVDICCTLRISSVKGSGASPVQAMADPQGDFKRKSKHWIHHTMMKTKQWRHSVQDQYKKNLDKRLRKQREVTTQGTDVFLQELKVSAPPNSFGFGRTIQGQQGRGKNCRHRTTRSFRRVRLQC